MGVELTPRRSGTVLLRTPLQAGVYRVQLYQYRNRSSDRDTCVNSTATNLGAWIMRSELYFSIGGGVNVAFGLTDPREVMRMGEGEPAKIVEVSLTSAPKRPI